LRYILLNVPKGMTMSQLTRRSFLTSASAAVAGSSVFLNAAYASGRVLGANDKVRIAVVGVNGRGSGHLQGYLEQKNVEIAYLVDPDQGVLAKRLKDVEAKSMGQQKPQLVADLRRALEDKTVDAISVATPNHWHALMTIWGAQAGKHVYVEKPMSHDVAEGRMAVEAQKKYGVVVQHGTQRRSDAKIAGLHEAIKACTFGRLKIAYGYCCKARGGIGFKPEEAPPANLDWDLWRGPAEIAAFHRNLVHYNWHWFWPTGNGDLNNQGTHQLDVARWAIDDDQTHPVKAMALGGRFQWKDQGVTPNTMFAMAEYPNGQQVFFNVRNVKYEGYQTQVENEYYFEDGGRIIRDKYFAKGSDKGEPLKIASGKVTPGGSFGSFIAAVRANDPKLANGNALDAHNACVLGHLMNNSYRLGDKAPFNAKAGSFGDNKEAGEHFLKLHEIMRKGVGVPEEGSAYTVGPVLTFDPKAERHVGDHAEQANALLKDPNRKGFEIPDIKA
jgi:predicted dehydrogenase